MLEEIKRMLTDQVSGGSFAQSTDCGEPVAGCEPGKLFGTGCAEAGANALANRDLLSAEIADYERPAFDAWKGERVQLDYNLALVLARE